MFFLFFGIIANDLSYSDKQDCFTETYHNNNKQSTVLNKSLSISICNATYMSEDKVHNWEIIDNRYTFYHCGCYDVHNIMKYT